MEYYVGIDLGTSSVKVLLLNNNGEVVSTVTKEYPLYFVYKGKGKMEFLRFSLD